MIRITFALCAMFSLASGQAADSGDNWLDANNYTDVARWMAEQPDAETRAAGLLTLTTGYPDSHRIEPEAFMGQVREMLDESASPPVLFLLAHGCASLDLHEACIRAGLDEAIVRHDGGNPLSRGALHEPGSYAFREVITSAERIDDYTIAFTQAWFEALMGHESAPVPAETALVASISLASAIATPGYSYLVRRCGEAVGEDATLDKACQGLAENLQQGHRNILTRTIGYGMARSRAEALGDDELAAEFAQRSEALMNEAASVAGEADDALLEPAAQRAFLSRWRDEGELAAFRYLREIHDGT